MVRRVVGMLAVIVGAAVFLYATWAAERLSLDAFRQGGWPRPFPYPDRWLLALNNYYDRKYPAAGFIKIHGELGRVLRDIAWASRAGVATVIVGLILILMPTFLRRIRPRGRALDVVKTAE